MKQKRIFAVVVFMLIAIFTCALYAVETTDVIYYVSTDGEDINEGTSWEKSFATLQKAIDESSDGDKIWVAAGTYKPTSDYGLDIGTRGKHFRMKNGVDIYGGFAGNEEPGFDLADRDFSANKTILSGDLNGDDAISEEGEWLNRSDNCYHVFYHPEEHISYGRLDGFTIQGGNADWPTGGEHSQGGGIHNSPYNSLTISNVIFSNNRAVIGAGIYNNENYYSIENCVFSSNYALFDGGGMYNEGYSSLNLTNCLFSGNIAGYNGGAIFNLEIGGYTLTLINCTISGNSAGISGGGIYNDGSSVQMYNSIIWGNGSEEQGKQLYNKNYGWVYMASTCYQNGSNDITGEFGADDGCITSDPLFVEPLPADAAPATGGNYRLQPASPAIDAGDNELTEGIQADLDGNPRVVDGTGDDNSQVDMGAYEFQGEASYEEQYTLVLASNPPYGGGTTFPSFGQHVFDEADIVQLSAYPDTGYGFVRWWGAVEDPFSENTTVEINGDRVVLAEFMPIHANANARLSSGHYHTLALKENGTVWAWGSGSYGRLGNGSNNNSHYPIPVLGGASGTEYLEGVIAVSSGNNHSLALMDDGTVYAWGDNSWGQVTGPNSQTYYLPRRVPGGESETEYLEDVIAVSAGAYHSTALKNDGTVYAWGLNSSGQLGNNSTAQSNIPVQVLFPNSSDVLQIIGISGSSSHSTALNADGTVYAWGDNQHGQLGNDSNVNSSIPVRVLGGASGTDFLQQITMIAQIHGSRNAALRADGTMWTWGQNNNGGLGDGTTTNKHVPIQVLGGASGTDFLQDVIYIEGGTGHTAAIKSDGTTWTWGWNAYGQLGDDSTSNRHVPIQVLGGESGADLLEDIIQISGAVCFTKALRKDGTVWAWGRNVWGQLGNNTTTSSRTPVQTVGQGDISYFNLMKYTVVFKTDGTEGADITGETEQVVEHGQNCQEVFANPPAEGWFFVNWTENGTEYSTDNPLTAENITRDKVLTANFTTDDTEYYDLDISSMPGGSVTTPGEGVFTYAQGTVVDLTANSDEEHRFDRWTGTAVSAGKVANPLARETTVTVDEDYNLIANFVRQYTLTMAASPADGGTTNPAPGDHTYDTGTIVNLTATPEDNWQFADWTGGVNDPNAAETIVNMDADKTVTANFVRTYILEVVSAYGDPIPAVGEHIYVQGEQVTASVDSPVVDNGTRYVCNGWRGTGDIPADGAANSTGAITITQDSSIEWLWKTQYRLTKEVLPSEADNAGCVIQAYPQGADSAWYDDMSTIVLTPQPAEGWRFTQWFVNGEPQSSEDELTVTMDEPKTVTANFDTTHKDWTLLFYMDGDNENEAAALESFMAISAAGSSLSVNVLVQLDRKGEDSRYGGWNTAKRFFVQKGMEPLAGNAIKDMGEINMGYPDNLSNFIEWGKALYPADRYALFLYGPGKGGWNRVVGKDSSHSGDGLSVKDIREAVEARDILDGTKDYYYHNSLELIVFDASCAGMVELAYELAGSVPAMVASETAIPLPGLPYQSIIELLSQAGAGYNGILFAEKIVDIFKNIYPTGQLAAIDTVETVGIAQKIRDFAISMLENNDDWLTVYHASRRAASCPQQSFADIRTFFEDVLFNASNNSIGTSAEDVLPVFDNAIIANYAGAGSNLSGLSIYVSSWGFPPADDYFSDTDFAEESDWFLFLADFSISELVPGHTGQGTGGRGFVKGGRGASAYEMISFPLVPDEPDLFANIEQLLGEYDPAEWRIFRWDTSLVPPGYREIKEDGEEIIPGHAYWLISSKDANIEAPGQLLPTNALFEIILLPGWNQIGSPFSFNIPWNALFATNGEETFGITSAANNLTSRILWSYTGTDYAPSDFMLAGHGYWLNNIAGYPVRLLVAPAMSEIGTQKALFETPVIKSILHEEKPPPPPGNENPSPGGNANLSQTGEGGCFIATACFGSPMADEVVVLKNFRDRHLSKYREGRRFVRAYYRLSPRVARVIATRPLLRAAVRISLRPVITACRTILLYR